jgi:hypothetical protein
MVKSSRVPGDAQLLLARERSAAAINRAYYAIFHAAEAAILSVTGAEYSRHSAGGEVFWGVESYRRRPFVWPPSLVLAVVWRTFHRKFCVRKVEDLIPGHGTVFMLMIDILVSGPSTNEKPTSEKEDTRGKFQVSNCL